MITLALLMSKLSNNISYLYCIENLLQDSFYKIQIIKDNQLCDSTQTLCL